MAAFGAAKIDNTFVNDWRGFNTGHGCSINWLSVVKMGHQKFWKLLKSDGSHLKLPIGNLSRPLYLAVHKPFANPHENFQSLIYLSWRKQLRTSFPQTWGQESQACCSYSEPDYCPSCRRVCAVQRNNEEGRHASEQDSSQLDNPLWESKTNHTKVTIMKLRKLWTPEIPMECSCVVRKKKARECKLQTAVTQ